MEPKVTLSSTTHETPSSETSQTGQSAVRRRFYQRRVTLTLTRTEAQVLRKALLRLGADPVARANAGLPPGKLAMKQFSRMWSKLDKAVVKRDQLQAAKEGSKIAQDGDIVIDLDVPLEGL